MRVINKNIRVGLAQIDPVVGDLKGNSAKILEFVALAVSYDCDIVCFPELALTGYPPEDLLLKDEFMRDCRRELAKLASGISDIVAIVGCLDGVKKDIYNSAAVVYGRKVVGFYHKNLLPNYGVFDEKRYFRPGCGCPVFHMDGVCFGVNICEDIWHGNGPLMRQARSGAGLIINISASPYSAGKTSDRAAVLRRRIKESGVWVVYLNLVGGQDELVFDGNSLVLDPSGKPVLSLKPFEEDFSCIDIPVREARRKNAHVNIVAKIKEKRSFCPVPPMSAMRREEEIYAALKLGLKDYVRKNGFKKVVIGLSGGIDSALTAAIASDALGPKAVVGVLMPSKYTSPISVADASRLAATLGIRLLNVPINAIFNCFLLVLKRIFKGCPVNSAEENLQARIRGNILMALSNKFGWLVLTTGNKSEVSTGYCTLYGDMAGGLDVLKDVPKSLVYELALYRNSKGRVIPKRSITRAPTAELRPGQRDSDSLPEYDILDRILHEYVEKDRSVKDICRLRPKISEDIISRTVRMVDNNEYKRRQAALGIKITPRAFGRDRRMPVTNKYQK